MQQRAFREALAVYTTDLTAEADVLADATFADYVALAARGADRRLSR
jgi:hypothetical protein